MNPSSEFSSALISLTPGKRVKYLRQKIMKQNQHEFCTDGIIRSGTLKSIESERMKIGEKISERFLHKFGLEGIDCESDIFLNPSSSCDIRVDLSKKKLVGESLSKIEEIRIKSQKLIPIEVTDDSFSPYIKKSSTLLVKKLPASHVTNLNKDLCYIQGSTQSEIYFLTFLSSGNIVAEKPGKKIQLTEDTLSLCNVFAIELIYFGLLS